MKKQLLIVEDEFIVANDLSRILAKAGFDIIGIADSYEGAMGILERKRPYIAILDIRLKNDRTGIDLAKHLQDLSIPFIYLSANSSKAVLEEAKTTNPYGFLVKPFRAKDVIVALEIASYHFEQSKKFYNSQEVLIQERLGQLLSRTMDYNDLCTELAKVFQSLLPFNYLELSIKNKGTRNTMGCNRVGLKQYQFIKVDELSQISGRKVESLKKALVQSPFENSFRILSGTMFLESLDKNPFKNILASSFGLNSQISCPLPAIEDKLITLKFYSRQTEVFKKDELNIIRRASPLIGKLLKNTIDGISGQSSINQVIKTEPEPDSSNKIFEGMVGNSPKLLAVQDQINKVAPMDTSVLIFGESGTGKELIAKSIHGLSKRKDKPFITINCGALPETLIESILFGHEKGAFTGASEKKIGKFEQANRGTIFLDEIGELPLQLQVKLLRVLQEKEIERLGSNKLIKLDVRILAATNKDLEKEIEAGRFRLDLFYRLNVFPITSPPLRERKEDIGLLANHFIKKVCVRNDRDILKIDEFVIAALMSYHWPGNIRELEHYMERSVLLAKTDTIKEVYFSYDPKDSVSIEDVNEKVKTIDEIEYEYITHILRKCKGKVSGKNGAAELLKISPSTLNSKMRRLGIDKNDVLS